MPRGIDVVDVVGDDFDAALADRVVEVAIEDDAHPLVPRLVARLEVGVDVVTGGQVSFGHLPGELLEGFRRLAGEGLAPTVRP